VGFTPKRPPASRPKPPKARSAAKYTGRAIAGAAAVLFAGCAYAYLSLPDVRPLAKSNPSVTAFMAIRTEEARVKGEEHRRIQSWVPLSHVSPELRRAVLIAEDDAFFQHEGVDFEQLRLSLRADWARGRFDRGASTITQQLAKNLYLSPSKNPLRKFRELVIARRLEAELTKDRILELYLNVIEWGDGIYGIEAASQVYYRRPASSLGPAESALLAGAIINPRRLNPAHPTKRLLRRQKLILQRMRSGVPAGTRPPAERKIEPPRPEEEEKLDDPKFEDEKPEDQESADPLQKE
jgi:monofunctional biosynthetic peptidoglycan transglycosylase